MTMISGAGGGGGSGKGGSKAAQKAPTEQKNSLFSSSYVKVVDLIGEGEIYGLFGGTVGDDPLKGVYLDNTPIREPNGAYNFTGVTFDSKNGVQWQSYLPGFDDIQSETIVNATVLQSGTGIVRTITNSSVNAVRVTVTVPALQEIKDNGDIKGASVTLKVQIQYSGGTYVDALIDTISGRTSQPYQKDYRINLSGAFPVVVRVVRVTADSSSAKLTNAFAWSSYTQITYSKLAYPNSAIVGLRIDSEQFNSIPTRSYRVRGLKVKIPNNGTVNQTTGAITYSGTWNGTFGGAQWTSDPAWCLYDLLTSRYGFKDHISEASLDKWSFYAASQYCGASVSNGLGGTEPRFSCNVNIQTQDDAYKVINDMASVFRAMPYWSTGTLALGQDKPADPAYLFTYANVEEAGFSYQSSSLKTRPTVAVVQYMDLNAREPNYEVVEDYAGIAKYGVIKTEITAFACTSRGQAYRLGAWLLYAAQNERETVNFTASIEAGMIVRPGQVIEISDPVRAGARRGGRISAATTTVVTIDDATNIAFATGCTLSVVLSTGLVETKNVGSISTANRTITLASGNAFSSAPNGNSVWVFETPSLQSTTWRVLSVQEEDQCKYNITALAYNSSKYNYVERGFALQSRSVSILNDPPDSPSALTVVEQLYTNAEQVRSKIILSWKGIPGTPNYIVKWRKDGGNWTSETREQQGFEILDVTPGYFEFAIYSISFLGISSTTPLYGNVTALGKTAPPANVTGFTATLDPDVGVTLSWNAVADLDVLCYQIFQIENGNPGVKLGDFTATSKKLGIPVVGTTTWTIIAQDTSNSYSVTPASASITISSATAPTTTGAFSGSTFTLGWTAVTGSLATDFYEVRYGTTSSTFATATALATVQGTTQSVEVRWSGVRRFFVAAVDIKGNVGAAASYDAVVASPSQVTMTQQVIDNNVLLQWSDGGIGGTLPIVSYELRKGATWATATYIGTKQGRFTTVFESAGAIYTYWIAAIDSAGNYGTPSSVNAQVSQPPDYVLKLNLDSTFSGTKTNLALQEGMGLVACVDTTETWQSHFTTRGWTTLQNQVSASPTPFPYYAMPSQTTGQYFEDIDYGTVLAGIKVTATLTTVAMAGATVVTPTIHIRGTTSTAATYSRSLTTVTVTTSTAHGLTAGRLVLLDFTSGGALDGSYVVLATGLTANAFTVTTAASGTISAGNTLTYAPWTTYAGVDSVFANNFRYVRVQYDFTSAGGDDLLGLTALNIRLDSKLRNDSGNGTAVSTDTGGTVVNFNYAFIDVDSLSVTPATTSPVIAVYDFVDTPYPTSFKVLLFNTSGTRVSGGFSWSARGT
jgi:predicted phage tail protein